MRQLNPNTFATANRAVFSDEPEAKECLATIANDWKPRTLSQIYKNNHHLRGPVVRVYADGVFDLFHHGHAEQLRQIKQLIPNSYLIVGVCNDEDVQQFKFGSTVTSTKERCELVSHCRYVDEVCRTPPFFPTEEFINTLKVDLVAHDCIPYAISFNIEDCYAFFKQSDRFLKTERTPNISTTDLIQRILDNLDLYKQRQAARLGNDKTSAKQ